MPAWIHDRAKHIMSKNKDMSESEAWAIATQQSHVLGKSPKSYGTAEGRATAEAKYPTPGDDEHKAAPKEKKAMNELVERMKAAHARIKQAEALEVNTGSVTGKNPVAPTPEELKGVSLHGHLWGQEPPKDAPAVGLRSPAYETFTDAVEQANKEQNLDLLLRAFTNMSTASSNAKDTVSELLVNGKPGKYVTHSKTLLERVRDL